MPLPVALLVSLLLHGLLFLPLIPAPVAPPRLEVRLPPLPEAEPPPSETAGATPELKPEMAIATPPAVAAPATPSAPAADRPRTDPAPPRPAQALASVNAPTQLRFYPEDAVRQGLEGDVVLQLALDDKGRVYAVEIISSSGHPILDRAAVTAAKNLGAMPGNPPRTRLPVSFRLTP